MKWPRASGILLHPTSLPGPYGIGDLGPGAVNFLDFLAVGHQKRWQVLPLNPTGYGNSPYAGLSAFAGNPLLISPGRLLDDSLLMPGDVQHVPDFPRERVDYGRAIPWKMALLRTAYARFRRDQPPALAADFSRFRARQAHWLADYALFAALKDAHAGRPWTEWPSPLAMREPAALDEARARLAEDIAFHELTQFLFFRQWVALRADARARGIRIIGDVAIFVAHDSADVWAHRELFQLNKGGLPTVVAGVPPDYFSATGQRWGNPLYRWDVLKQQGYGWWIERLRATLELVDIIRLDHFRGFHAYWEIPAECETAVEGRWAPGPGAALFAAIRADLGDLPLIAEDLGQITLGVHRLRQKLELPGMRVLQFGFGGNAKNQHLPHNFTRDTAVYTGTHDNDTTRGWFTSVGEREREHVLRYLHSDEEGVVEAMVRAAFASVAALAVVPLADVLDLGSVARMNFPSRAAGNWEWRVTQEQLTPSLSKRLAQLSSLYGR
ncbi:MAG TPA: 4-alpha-glucanotransferase [Ktedonobacterales bacterium]|nr:4-alpha-glucanotransferase [Ktedonobacterales bacterium]